LLFEETKEEDEEGAVSSPAAGFESMLLVRRARARVAAHGGRSLGVGASDAVSSVAVGSSSYKEPDRSKLFRLLELSTFSDDELRKSRTILLEAQEKGNNEELKQLAKILLQEKQQAGDATSVEDSGRLGSSQRELFLEEKEFETRVRKLGEKLDQRIYPIALSFFGTGLSIGVIIPILPLLVQQIDLPPSQFGLVVASFGLAKLLGNIPTAALVESWGRKPVMVLGMNICAVGLGSVGLCLLPGLGAPFLIACRFITGLGVSAFTSAAFVYISDCSTALNRTRTIAPVMMSFQVGTALGPAIGGLAVSQLGIAYSYAAVGASIASLGLMNHLFLSESKSFHLHPPAPTSTTLSSNTTSTEQAETSKKQHLQLPPFEQAMVVWRELLKEPELRNVVIVNTIYWTALAGTQMTMLPLLMVSPAIALTPAQIGLTFACMSVTSVASSQPSAMMADKIGKRPAILTGLALMSTSMFLLPYSSSFESLLLALVPLSIGSTFLSSVPTALVGDLSSPENRSQALALLRTAGDVGLLVGAVSSGVISDLTSISSTVSGNGALLCGATFLYSMAWKSKQLKE